MKPTDVKSMTYIRVFPTGGWVRRIPLPPTKTLIIPVQSPPLHCHLEKFCTISIFNSIPFVHMLILTLIDIQYSQKVAFSFLKIFGSSKSLVLRFPPLSNPAPAKVLIPTPTPHCYLENLAYWIWCRKNNDKYPKFQLVLMWETKYRNIFAKDYIQILSEQDFVVKPITNTVLLNLKRP